MSVDIMRCHFPDPELTWNVTHTELVTVARLSVVAAARYPLSMQRKDSLSESTEPMARVTGPGVCTPPSSKRDGAGSNSPRHGQENKAKKTKQYRIKIKIYVQYKKDKTFRRFKFFTYALSTAARRTRSTMARSKTKKPAGRSVAGPHTPVEHR